MSCMASTSALESQMNQILNQMEDLNINLRLTANDLIGSILAIQARRGLDHRAPLAN